MQNYLRELVFIVFDRSRLIVQIFTVVFLLGLLAAIFLPPVYRSSAKFTLSIPQQLDPLQKETSFDYKNRLMRLMQDQKEIIYSNRVLQKVVASQFSDVRPEGVPNLLDKLREDIDVTPPGGETFEGSSVFYLSYRGKDPSKVANVTKAIADAYLESYSEVTKAKTDYSHEFFKGQSEALLETMKLKEAALRQYETEKADLLIEMLNLEPNKTNLEVGLNSLLTDVQRKRNDLYDQLVGATKSLEAMEKELKGASIPVVLPEMEVHGRAITAFKNKVAQLQIQLNEMKSQFEPGFAPLKQVEEELKLNVRSLREELNRVLQAQRVTVNALEAKIKEQDRAIESLRNRLRSIGEEKSVYEHLKQEFALAKDAYTGARSQLEQARMANAVSQEKQFITMVDPPEVANKPFKPNRLLLALLGFFGGWMMAVAIALLVDHLDHSIKKPQDVERYLGLNVVGSVSKMI